MALPKAVQVQVDEVKRIEEEMLKEQTASTDTPVNEEPVSTDTPPEEPVVEPVSEPVVETKPEEKPAEPDYRTLFEKEKARADTLEGKYRAEVPRLNEQVKELKSTVDEILKSKPIPEPAKTETKSSRAMSETEQDYMENFPTYHQAIVDAVHRIFGDLMANYKNPEFESVKASVTETRQDAFLTKLDSLVASVGGDLSVLNYDPEFIGWLEEPDGLSGVAKKVFFDDYVQRGDAQKVARYFKGYMNQKNPSPDNPPADESLSSVKTPVIDKNKLIAPSASLKREDINKKPTKIWKQAEVEQFYRDAIQKKFTPEQKANLEAEINRAAAEGRIQ